MITNTLLIFGPGGIGKGPVDDLIRDDAVRIDPYRLRQHPRDTGDVFYAHSKLHSELSSAFVALGDEREELSSDPSVEWFPAARAAFFKVRADWQCLLLGALSAVHAKAEIYAPAVPVLFQRQDVRSVFGALSIVILNPVESLRSLSDDFTSLKKATDQNCTKRGDDTESVKNRTESIDHEVGAWLKMLALGGTEYTNWRFPEYIYRDNRTETLLDARRELLSRNRQLEQFLKSEAEIREYAARP